MCYVTEIYCFGERLNADIFCLAFEGNNPAEEPVNTGLPQLHRAPAVGLQDAAHLLGSQGCLSAPVPGQGLFLSLFHSKKCDQFHTFFFFISLESMHCFLNKQTIFIVQVIHGHLRKL